MKTLRCLLPLFLLAAPALRAETPSNFQRENLIAWCIVPFDSMKRTPAERTQMLLDLGLKRCAYDWRQEHIASFEEEFQLYQKNGIELFAFWNEHPDAYRLFAEYGLKPQIWKTVPSPNGETRDARVKLAADKLEPSVKKAQEAGLKFGLYNHGNWGGQPANMVAICQALRSRGYDNTGIVYNFHHAHHDRREFLDTFAEMKPLLFCLNLDGLLDPDKVDVTKLENKIRPIGSGDYEKEMIQTVIASGYSGPIGILGHRPDKDVKEMLQGNLEGLDKLLKELE